MKRHILFLVITALVFSMCSCSVSEGIGAKPAMTPSASKQETQITNTAWPEGYPSFALVFGYGTYMNDATSMRTGDITDYNMNYTGVKLDDIKAFSEEMSKAGYDVAVLTDNSTRYKVQGTLSKESNGVITILVNLEIASGKCSLDAKQSFRAAEITTQPAVQVTKAPDMGGWPDEMPISIPVFRFASSVGATDEMSTEGGSNHYSFILIYSGVEKQDVRSYASELRSRGFFETDSDMSGRYIVTGIDTGGCLYSSLTVVVTLDTATGDCTFVVVSSYLPPAPSPSKK